MSDTTGQRYFDNMDPNQTGPFDASKLPKLQEPLENIDTPEYKYYHCSAKNHHMHRHDGLKIVFFHQIHKTNAYYTQQYLDKEIRNQNPYVRAATPQEIETYNMIMDPKGTIEKELRPQLEAQITADLTNKLKSMIKDGKVNLTESQIEALLSTDNNLIGGIGDGSDNPKPPVVDDGNVKLVPVPAAKLGGIVNTAALRDAIAGHSK